jgi:predicted nucleotidyltransferase
MLPYYTIPHISNTLDLLKERYPRCIFYDPYSKMIFSAVPVESIVKHFCPEKKLQRLLKEERRDMLEEDAVQLVSILSERSMVPEYFFGVTGSILIGIHRPTVSDIDLIVLGRENSLKVRAALLNLYSSEGSPIKKFSDAQVEEWCETKASLYPLSRQEAEAIYGRVWNRGVFNGVNFSVHPVRLDWEIADVYGDKTFNNLGLVEIDATIEDAADSLFLPATYRVAEICFKSGVRVEGVREVVSFEGLYGGIYQKGETVFARGVLEEVREIPSGKDYYRVVVGSLAAGGMDFIKLKGQ